MAPLPAIPHLLALWLVWLAPALVPAQDAGADEGVCAAGGDCEGGVARSARAGRLELPRVIIGCWQLLERHASKEHAIKTLLEYAEAGFDAFDTADIYGPSEGILGDFRRRWVALHPTAPPLRFFTKYVTDSPGEGDSRSTNARSLRNLGVDSADMVQFHWWSLSKDASDKTFLQAGRHLTTLKGEGKIKRLAGCNMDAANLRAMVEDGMPVEANQVQYSLLDRRPEVRLLQYCREKDIQLTVFGVVAGGLLSEAFLGLSKQAAEAKLDSVSRRMYWSSLQRWSHDWALFQKLLRTLGDVGARKQPALPIAAVASLWALRRLDELGAGGALILGVRDARHIEEHTALLRGEASLTPADMMDISEVLEEGNPPVGDIWHQERGWA